MSNVMAASPAAAPAPAPAPAGQNLSLLPQVGQPGAWKAWVAQPENRAMLVQAGISLLQPTGVGQTMAGHVGGAIGSGMEARDRVVAGEQEQEQRTLQNTLAQQEADARTLSAQASMTNAERQAAGGGLTPYQMIQLDRGRAKDFRAFVAAKERNLFPGDQLPDVETLAAEFEQLNAVAPGLPGAGGGTPSLAEAIPGATPGGAQSVAPPQSHIDYLRQNPGAAADFDAKYGAGASQQYLGT